MSDVDLSHVLNLLKTEARRVLRMPYGWFDADDLAMELFVKVLEKSDTDEEILERLSDPVVSRRMLRNLAIDVWRREKAIRRGGTYQFMPLESIENSPNYSLQDNTPEPEQLIIQNEEALAGKKLISLLSDLFEKAGLSPSEKESLELAMAGWKAADIAEHQGVSINTQYTRLSRAREKLRFARQALGI